jgi:uncharacterized protein (TIGR02145 family)
MIRILFLMMLPFVCFSQITPREDIQVNSKLIEKENLDTKRKASYNLDEIKVRWKKAALENCTGVPCIVTPPAPPAPPAPSFTCGTSTVTDVDNNIYNTVAIGTGTTAQCWTASNLKVTKYNDGSPITPDATGTSTGSGIGEMWSTRNSGAYTIYEHNNANVTTYGLLYNWFAATDAKKLCPDGWHVPSDAEWTIMIQTLDPLQLVTSVNVSTFTGVQSSTAGTVMKSTTVEWNPGSPRTNTSGFSALPGGYREFYGSFDAIRNFAWFWSATEYDGSYAWYRALSNVNGFVDRGNYWKTLGASVRCLRD